MLKILTLLQSSPVEGNISLQQSRLTQIRWQSSEVSDSDKETEQTEFFRQQEKNISFSCWRETYTTHKRYLYICLLKGTNLTTFSSFPYNVCRSPRRVNNAISLLSPTSQKCLSSFKNSMRRKWKSVFLEFQQHLFIFWTQEYSRALAQPMTGLHGGRRTMGNPAQGYQYSKDTKALHHLAVGGLGNTLRFRISVRFIATVMVQVGGQLRVMEILQYKHDIYACVMDIIIMFFEDYFCLLRDSYDILTLYAFLLVLTDDLLVNIILLF